jgi:type IV pilus assembly protein PilQ
MFGIKKFRKKCLSLCVVVWLAGTIPAGAAENSLVNMTVTNAEVRDVLMSLASVGNVNLVVDDSVTGNITIQLHNVPFDDALEIVTQTKGLTYEQVGNVILVANAGDSQSTDGKPAGKSNKHFGSVHVVKLQHVKAEDIIDKVALLLNDSGDSSSSTSSSSSSSTNSSASSSGSTTQGSTTTTKISPKDSASDAQSVKSTVNAGYKRTKVDTISNSIVFLGSQRELEKVQALVNELDVFYPEVLLEAQIISIDKIGSEALGIDWVWSSAPQSPQSTTVSTPQSQYGGIVHFGNNYQFQYQATISALQKKGNVKILAKPKILAINGKSAFIQVGDSLPIATQNVTTTGTQTSYTYVNSGIILTYIPYINADNSITAQIQTEVSTPTWVADLKTYQFSKKIADTEVRMKDGETIVIAGLMNTQDTKSLAKVPFLSDLPFLGGLFKSKAETNEDHEVVIFITAHIVKDQLLSSDMGKNSDPAASPTP